METGIELIAKEREEQITKHGYTSTNDSEWEAEELAWAAAHLIGKDFDEQPEMDYARPQGWNKEIFEKMWNKPRKERLIIAGALIAAEIDRLNSKV